MAPGSALIPRLVDLGPRREALRDRFALSAHPESVAGARRLTRARLTAWRVDQDTMDAAVLIVSELVTNAVVHTASARVVCELEYSGAGVRVSVTDQGHQPDGPRLSPASEDEHGRGLLLVDSLSTAWGAHEAADGCGRVVWARLPAGSEAAC